MGRSKNRQNENTKNDFKTFKNNRNILTKCEKIKKELKLNFERTIFEKKLKKIINVLE